MLIRNVEVTDSKSAFKLIDLLASKHKVSRSAIQYLGNCIHKANVYDEMMIPGEWVRDGHTYICSWCDSKNAAKRKYCPNCGKIMIANSVELTS